MTKTLTASAPGSIMITGEHAVVYGAPAIVCAIEQRIRIRVSTRADREIHIESALAAHHTDLATLADHPQLRFLIAALRQNPPASGLDIAIDSDIDPTLGLGSSAAVTAAITALLYRLRGQNPDLLALHRAAYRTILTVQQRGSGADLAASLAGGIIAYQNRPFTVITPLRRAASACATLAIKPRPPKYWRASPPAPPLTPNTTATSTTAWARAAHAASPPPNAATGRISTTNSTSTKNT